jgi:hypothetical protein
MNEVPHRVVIDLEPALGQLIDQPADRKILLVAPLNQPLAIFTLNLFRTVAAHFPGRAAARLPVPLNPTDHGARDHAKARRRLPTRHFLLNNRFNRTFPKIL